MEVVVIGGGTEVAGEVVITVAEVEEVGVVVLEPPVLAQVETKVTIECAGALPVTWPLLIDTVRAPRSVPCADTYAVAETSADGQGETVIL